MVVTSFRWARIDGQTTESAMHGLRRLPAQTKSIWTTTTKCFRGEQARMWTFIFLSSFLLGKQSAQRSLVCNFGQAYDWLIRLADWSDGRYFDISKSPSTLYLQIHQTPVLGLYTYIVSIDLSIAASSSCYAITRSIDFEYTRSFAACTPSIHVLARRQRHKICEHFRTILFIVKNVNKNAHNYIYFKTLTGFARKIQVVTAGNNARSSFQACNNDVDIVM